MTDNDENYIRCFCDHCPNNTCITNKGGLCYAEWRPINPLVSQQPTIVSTTPTYNSSTSYLGALNHYVTSTSMRTNEDFDLETRYNCYNKGEPLIFKTIVCNETVSNTSRVIRRCCNSGDYCNRNDFLLPSRDEATKLFGHFYPQQQQTTFFGDLIKQYSFMPLGYKITINIAAIFIILYVIALARQSSPSRRKHRESGSLSSNGLQTTRGNTIKRFIARMINLNIFGGRGRRQDAGSQAFTVRLRQGVRDTESNPGEREHLAQTPAISDRPTTQNAPVTASIAPGQQNRPLIGKAGDDISENSSFKASSAVYDSNSMASREPLINNARQTRLIAANNIHHPLHQHHPGPFVSDDNCNGKAQQALHMTIGSAAPDYGKNDTSSGSGAGQPYLTQRSIAHDIELKEVVGRGFYGVVWRGEYKGEPVAVKIFSPMAERSWEREAEIYQTAMLRHKNILGIIATDKRHDAGLTAYWLVTDYYPIGSLYDFLKENTMSMADAVRMAFSIANGLSHLHVEIFGTRGKPAIAHRDIKSKNVLVKNDGTCCIADLGMAVRYNSHTGIVDVPTNTRVGTRRYLAPEILENRLNMMDFEGVKSADMYSMGLVMWEIIRRACLVNPSPNGEIDPSIAMTIEQQRTQTSSSGVSPMVARQRLDDNSFITSQQAPEGSSILFPVDDPEQLLSRQNESNPQLERPTVDETQQATIGPLQESEIEPKQQASIYPQPGHPFEAAQTLSHNQPELFSDISPHKSVRPLQQAVIEMPAHQAYVVNQNRSADIHVHRPNFPEVIPEEEAEMADEKPQDDGLSGDQPPLTSTPQPQEDSERVYGPKAPCGGSMETTIEDLTHEYAMITEPYEVPYQNLVSLDPTAEEMRDAVCVRKLRPTVSFRWSKFRSMRDYSNIMAECWYEKPQARLSALRVRKSLGDIAKKYFNMNMEYD